MSVTAIQNAVAMAKRLIDANGEPCQWIQAGADSTPNPAQPWIKEVAAPTVQNVSFLFKVTPNSPFLTLVAGSNVEAGTIKALMPPVAFTPSLTDNVVRSDGTKLAVKSINPLNMNGQIVMYYLSLNK